MQVAANVLVGLVAVLHFYFLYLEMFQWTKPQGLKIFRQTLAQAQSSKVLAMNQGLYNGFLAAGLVFGLLQENLQFKLFFLSCVILAGIFGALTVSRGILWVQAAPALAALVLLLM
ncbi:MAG: DUF1304 domain-containing protein [Bdellovibrionales bacterium]